MAKKVWWDELGIVNGVATTYEAISSGSYTPVVNARLVAIMLVMAGDAATSLLEHLSVKLQEPKWGRDFVCAQGGAGLRTAPAFPIANAMFECDLPVTSTQKITILDRWNVTPTTPHVTVMGLFEANE